ncbi:MAG: 4'-phosphopantetheinyl transferase superfamily protein [Blastocatellia bacterium]|nr:4'-phosphopantetheinyl transferase superfamily protein [Blastocatellia bacterium]
MLDISLFTFDDLGTFSASLTDTKQVDIWILDFTLLKEEEMKALLSTEEVARAAAFYFERDRRRYACCRGFLRKILSIYIGKKAEEIEFLYGEYGKPFLLGQPVEFNLSHSGNFLAFAITIGGKIGVDIELLREMSDIESIVKHYFAPQECQKFLSFSLEERMVAFFNCWTRKEAFIKATGKGLSEPLDAFTVSLESDDARLIWVKDREDELKDWEMVSIRFDQYVVAVARKFGQL